MVYFSNMMGQPKKREPSDPENRESSTGKKEGRPGDYKLCSSTSKKIIKL